jgi:hypothetical protein
MEIDKDRIETAAKAICRVSGYDPESEVRLGRYNPEVASRFGFEPVGLRDHRSWMDFIEEAANHVAAFDALRSLEQNR